MARNGAGVYSLPPGSLVTNGDTSDQTDLNTPLTDIETDMNTARPVVAGGTGATTAADARTNLGVSIGADVQGYDAALASIAALGTAADKGIYTTGVDTFAEFDLTAAGRALLDDASATAQRTTLGLGTAAIVNTSDDTDLFNDVTLLPLRRTVLKTRHYSPTAQLTATGTAANVWSNIPDWVCEIKIEFAGVSYTSSEEILVQLGTSGGMVTTGYTCTTHRALDNEGVIKVDAVTGGFGLNDVGGWNGYILLTRFDSSTTVWHATFQAGNSAGNRIFNGAGYIDLGAALTQLQVVSQNGVATHDAGTMGMGYR